MAYLAIRGERGGQRGQPAARRGEPQACSSLSSPAGRRTRCPVGHVTNGVHVPSWDSPEADALWTKVCGKERWLGDPRVSERPHPADRATRSCGPSATANRRKLIDDGPRPPKAAGTHRRQPGEPQGPTSTAFATPRVHPRVRPPLRHLQASGPAPPRPGTAGAHPLRPRQQGAARPGRQGPPCRRRRQGA